MAPNTTPEEWPVVRRRAHTGVLLALLIFLTGLFLLPAGKEQDFPSPLEKFIYTLRWQSLSVMTFLFGIMRVANMRSRTAAIDPISGKGEQLIVVYVRYLQNTLEQLVLSVTGQLILSTYLSASLLTKVVPSLVTIFVLGRVLFYVGYTISPFQRGTGFAMTFIPSLLVNIYGLLCFFGIFNPTYIDWNNSSDIFTAPE